MLALTKTHGRPGLELVQSAVPEVRSSSVLVRVLRTGICGTDLHIANWDPWAEATVVPPLVLGHEFTGEVVEVGIGVTDVAVGDIVSGEGHLVCGRCRNCRAGRRHLCIETVGIGVNTDGAFAEYLTVPASNVWVHRFDIDLDVAAIFDPFGNAVHAALTFPVMNEDVLVTGAGPIGIMAAVTAKHAGARSVVVTDVSRYRLKLAERMGADFAVNIATDSLADVMGENGMTEGFDVALEMSGATSAFETVIANVRPGARVAMLGLPAEKVRLDLAAVVTKMLTLQGIYGRQMYDTWYAMTVMLERGMDIGPLITHRFGYEQYEQAFAVARSGHCGKVVIDWTRPVVHAAAASSNE